MNFQQLRHFVVTAETGNILKAAEIVYISQSGLSRSISALEHQLGLPLFERSAKGVELTTFGRHFYPSAKLILNEQRRAVEELKSFRELRSGSLTLGINHSFAYMLVPETIAELLRSATGVSLSITTGNYQTLARSLAEGDLDLVLSLYTKDSRRDDLHYEQLFDLRTRIHARAGHPLHARTTLDPGDLADFNWALIDGASAQAAFAAFFARHGLPVPNVSLRCASMKLLTAVVEGTDLLTILPEEIVSHLHGESLRPLPLAEHFGVASVGLIRRNGSGEFPLGERVSKLIRRRVARMRESFALASEGDAQASLARST